MNKKTRKCTCYVKGMHCAACELLIEKKLLEKEEINYVQASLGDQKLEFSYTGERSPDIATLNKEFAELGYSFTKEKPVTGKTPLFEYKKGELLINREKFSDLIKLLPLIIVFLLLFFVLEDLQLARFITVDSGSALTAFTLLGLIAGISSCAALIGGLLLSLVKQWHEAYPDTGINRGRLYPHVLFHGGRLFGFTLFGGMLGLFGSYLSFDNTVIFALITLAVSLLMLVITLQMLGFERFRGIRFTLPKSISEKLMVTKSDYKYQPTLIGAGTFFLPCGFTLIAQTAALATGSVINSALLMLMFALGTAIPLGIISFTGVAFTAKPHLTAKFNIVAGVLIVFFAIYNINGQLNVLGLPSLNDWNRNEIIAINTQIIEPNSTGEQILNITAKGFSYVPMGSTTLTADIPSKLVVYNQGIQGCGAFIAATGLFNGYVELELGENIIDLGVPKSGSYKLTCSMGMVEPVIINVI